jgi:tetratricopeptide (TPR) repeat protein
MPQPMPVVRQLYRPALVPQFIAIASIAAVVRLCFPWLPLLAILIAAPLIYLVFCRIMRAFLVREHGRGMRAYRAKRFQDAIAHFQASHQYFSEHRRLDSWRSLIFGVASYNPYRVIALGNMAYCYSQLGDGAKAIELYEQVLREAPNHAVAESSLKMLRAVPPPASAA